MSDKKWVLWENEEMSLQAAFNPSIPRKEGFHIVLLPKKSVPSAWADSGLYGRMSVVAAQVSGVIMAIQIADWVNIHCDGNIGIANGKPKLHVHIYGRYRTGEEWGGPLKLPFGERQYGNDPLTDQEIESLRLALTDFYL